MVDSLRSAGTKCAQLGPDETSSDGVLQRSQTRRVDGRQCKRFPRQ